MARLLILPLLDETGRDNRDLVGAEYFCWSKRPLKQTLRPLYLKGIPHFPNDDYLQPIYVGSDSVLSIYIDGKKYSYDDKAVIELNLEKGVHRIKIDFVY